MTTQPADTTPTEVSRTESFWIRTFYPGTEAVISTSGSWDTQAEAQAALDANPDWFTFEGRRGCVIKKVEVITEEIVL